MTQDEIIEFTKRSGLGMLLKIGGMDKCLEYFAKLVAQHEREACAEICDEFPDVGYVDKKLTGDYHSYLIRQRGQE